MLEVEHEEMIRKMELELKDKEHIICELQEEICELEQTKLQTKGEKGYSENVRLCIMELAGLKVATEKCHL